MYWAKDGESDVLVQYGGDFGHDPYLDNGWIKNVYFNSDGTTGSYLIVHKTPRYTRENPIWGDWDVVVDTVSRTGNIANLMHPEYVS